MKRQIKFLSVPLHVWTHADLSVFEKVVLIELDSYNDGNGCACGVQTISSAIGLPVKTVKETLKSLQSKGAIEVRIDADGAKRVIPYLYRERYVENPNAVVVGDKPSDVERIDYDYIQEQWNSICTMLPKLDRLTPRRKSKIRTCLKGVGASVSDLIKVFRLVATSGFLNGSKSKEWACTFDWVIKSPDNFTKIIEGQYHKDYSEKRDYELIRNGGEVNQKTTSDDEYYR